MYFEILPFVAIPTAALFVLLKVRKKTTVRVVQEATVGCKVNLDLLVLTDEKKFEDQVAVLLEELSKEAIFLIENRLNQLEFRLAYLMDQYSSEEKEISVKLTSLISAMPKSITRSKRFQEIRDNLRFDLACEEPLRFFQIVQNIDDEYEFRKFCDYLVEKNQEKRFKKRIDDISKSYDEIRLTIREINKVSDDLASLNRFLDSKSALIEAIRNM